MTRVEELCGPGGIEQQANAYYFLHQNKDFDFVLIKRDLAR
jgi:hypothetical protein